MSLMFEPFVINGLELANRLVRSATFDSAALPDGEVSPDQEKLYADLAAGGVGLIVSGITCVDRLGRVSPLQNGAEDDGRLEGLTRLAEAAHRHGGKAALQLHHGGADARHFRKGEPLALGPSDPQGAETGWRAATGDELLELTAAFAAAAGRARRAGFDAVQVHGAHGYLFSQFLSPLTNRRRDAWGGDLDGRLRLHRETLTAIRREVGPDYPVLIKLGVADGPDGGLTLAEGLAAARACVAAGADAVEVSLGLRGDSFDRTEFHTDVDRPGRDRYYRDWCRRVKAAIDAPAIMVGGLREPAHCEEVLAAGDADLVGLSRPLIREPDLPARWRDGGRERATCISCNGCLREVRRRKPVRCVAARKGEDA